MNHAVSVIVCTHNPRWDYFSRVLVALKLQTLPLGLWELLLIDNASDTPVAQKVELGWHPHARHLQEERLGLTPARLRGIEAAQGDLLIFVDDDNVLEPDYLEMAWQIYQSRPMMGAWGGLIRPEFEAIPPPWLTPFLPLLAIREFTQDRWSNLRYQNDTTPCGAGLCVRQEVAQTYTKTVSTIPKRSQMGRRGQVLMAGEDSDLALTACDRGQFTGQFTALKLTHLISAQRLEQNYLIRLAEGIGYSQIAIASFRDTFPPAPSWKRRLKLAVQYGLMHPKARQIYDAVQRGRAIATQELAQEKWNSQEQPNEC